MLIAGRIEARSGSVALTTGPAENMNRDRPNAQHVRSEEHTSELQSLMRISYAVFCLKQKRYIQSHCQRRSGLCLLALRTTREGHPTSTCRRSTLPPRGPGLHGPIYG